MALSPTSTTALQKSQPIHAVIPKPEFVPTKERDLEEHRNYLFGLCKGCGYPIKYAPVRLPDSCTDVSPENSPEATRQYQIIYKDYHLACAAKRIISSGQVDVELHHNIKQDQPKGIFKSKLSPVTVSSTIIIPTHR